VTSFFRSLKDYLEDNLDTDIYDLVMSYPSVDTLQKKMPEPQVIIHFDIADPNQVFFGLGENLVNNEYQEPAGTVVEWEAHMHEITMDVGIWSSIPAGGPSGRMTAYEDLAKLFTGPHARDALMTATNGIELLHFAGGRNITDNIGDIDVFRMVDVELRLRVFSRTKLPAVPYIHSADQDPGLTIDDNVTIDA
jgi:hypothetical protein